MDLPPYGTVLGRLSDLPDPGGREAGWEATPLFLVRKGSDVRCFVNICPHAGRALDWAPGRFLMDNGHLVCAAHGAVFTVPDGNCVSGPCRGQRLHEVPIELRERVIYLTSES